MNEKSRFDPNDTIPQTIMKMSDGNPGALKVLCGIDPFMILGLDNMRIYGPNIWIGFKDVCEENFADFEKRVRDGSLKELVEKSPHYIS